MESKHHVVGVVQGLAGGAEARFGDPQLRAHWRSAMKPFQALPAVGDGALETYELGSTAIALCCASHHGTPQHVAGVREMMRRIGVSETSLACGPHPPFDEEAARSLLRGGEDPGRLHNNCSGKHVGMLALALHHGWPTDGYAELEHPVQRRIRAELACWLDEDPEELAWARDGCGVPTPYLSLRQMARAYARLGEASREESAARRVVEAMTGHPDLVGGATALSTRIMQTTGGRVLAKEGAEGVFCATAPDSGWGAAVKVADGSARAVGPAFLELLGALRLLTEPELASLSSLRRLPVLNTQGMAVGMVTAEVHVPRVPAGR